MGSMLPIERIKVASVKPDKTNRPMSVELYSRKPATAALEPPSSVTSGTHGPPSITATVTPEPTMLPEDDSESPQPEDRDDMKSDVADGEEALPPLRLISRCILRRGDDIRKNRGAIDMFRFMNSVWNDCNLYYCGYPVYARIYRVYPMGDDFGALEFVENAKSLKNVLEWRDEFTDKQMKNLVATAAASFCASYVIGVRDNHWNNLLITGDGTLFHIDFGFIMSDPIRSGGSPGGSSSSSDLRMPMNVYKLLTSLMTDRTIHDGDDDEVVSDDDEVVSDEDEDMEEPLPDVLEGIAPLGGHEGGAFSLDLDTFDEMSGVPIDVSAVVEKVEKETDYFNDFVECATEAYMLLRNSFTDLAEFAQITFACTQLKDDPELFLARRLQLGNDDEIVRMKMRRKFRDAWKHSSARKMSETI
jgi:hypothetical protein